MTGELVLSVFPGIGILDRGFEENGFTVVRGPDLLWGGDIKLFHPPAGVFDGVIGGPPCQGFSSLVHMVRHMGYRVQANLIPEFERIVSEAQPRWFVMENVVNAPLPNVAGYTVDPSLLNNRWLGHVQNRLHRFSFGTRDGRKLHYRPAFLSPRARSHRVLGGGRVVETKDEKGNRRLHRLGYRSKRHLAENLVLQGLPEDFFKYSPFTVEAMHKAIGNAVALPMALELARAVREAIEKEGA